MDGRVVGPLSAAIAPTESGQIDGNDSAVGGKLWQQTPKGELGTAGESVNEEEGRFAYSLLEVVHVLAVNREVHSVCWSHPVVHRNSPVRRLKNINIAVWTTAPRACPSKVSWPDNKHGWPRVARAPRYKVPPTAY